MAYTLTHHTVDIPPWLKPLGRKVGVNKWLKSAKRFDRNFYFEALDEVRTLRINHHGADPNDGLLASTIALMIDDIGDLRAHAHKEGVEPNSKEEWADITEAAAWFLLERYHRDIAKGKWP